MIFLKRLAGVILTAIFCIAFPVELMLYTLRWLITGLPLTERPYTTRTYQRVFDKFINI